MKTEMKKVIERKLVEIMVVPFGQFNHDRVKSVNGDKFQSFSFQFVKVDFERNLVLHMGCKHCDDNSDKGVAALLDTTSTEVICKDVDDLISIMKSDGTDIGVSIVLGMEDTE